MCLYLLCTVVDADDLVEAGYVALAGPRTDETYMAVLKGNTGTADENPYATTQL